MRYECSCADSPQFRFWKEHRITSIQHVNLKNDLRKDACVNSSIQEKQTKIFHE